MKKTYWIHGKMNSGKSVLARHIAGPDAVVIHRGSTRTEATRMMQGAKAVIFEEFMEESDPNMSLITCALDNGTISKGSPDGRSIRQGILDVEMIVVVSLSPPKCKSTRSRFHLVKIKQPS